MTADDDQQFVPLLTELERSLRDTTLDMETATSLVRYALTGTSDFWADLALAWVEQGVEPHAVEPELIDLASAGRERPQALRHRARRLVPRSR